MVSTVHLAYISSKAGSGRDAKIEGPGSYSDYTTVTSEGVRSRRDA